ncbi:flippase [Candidatus Pacearchaeota archaeon]|nr:flippase [Candidatus Pacearchaeota archaeon]
MKGRANKLDSYLKLIVKTSFFVFIALMLSKIINYVYRIIVARYFGVEIYGLYSLALMILGWIVAFASFGLIDGLVRYISIYRGKNQSNKINCIFRFAFNFLLVSSLIAGILLFFLSEIISVNIFHDARLIIFLRIFSIVIPLSILANVFLSALRAFEKIVWYSFIINIFQNAARAVILVILIIMGMGYNSVVFSYLLGAFLMLLISYFVCRYLIINIFKKPSAKQKEKLAIRKEILFYSWPLMFYGLFASIFYWEDTLMIGFFKTALEVGLYNAAIPIVFLLNFVHDLFMQLFFPLITKEFSRKNFYVIKELSKQVGKWILILNLPLFLIMLVFPELIIKLLFGAEYISAAIALRILAVGGIISFIAPLANSLLFMIGKSRMIMTNLVIMIILNFILNAILIPPLGITGAAIATTISGIVLTLILLFEIKHSLSFFPLKRKMLRILIVSLIPLSLLIIAKLFFELRLRSFILLSLLFFSLYLLIIFITGCLDKNDISIIDAFKRKGRGMMPQNSANNN